MGIGDLRGADDVRLRDLVPAVRYVLADRRVEQEGLLRDDAEQPPVGRLLERLQIPPVDRHRSTQGVVETKEEVGERRLARAARPDQRDDLALLDLERHAAQDRLAAVVERHVMEDDPVAELRDRAWTVLHRGLEPEQLVEPVRRRERRLDGRVGAAQQPDLRHDRAANVEEQEERRRREVARQELPRGQRQQRRLSRVTDDRARRLLRVLVGAKLDGDADDLAQRDAEPRQLECLRAERLDHPNAQDRLLKARDEVGERGELVARKPSDRAPDRPGEPGMEERGAGRRQGEPRARPHQQPAVERDEHRRREHGGHNRLETGRGRPRVRVETRDQLAGSPTAEEAHREPEQMAKQIALHRGRRAHPDPEREQVVAEIDPALEKPGADVHAAEDEDGVEPILHRGDPEPPEDGGAKITE